METNRITLMSARSSNLPAIGLANWWCAIRANHLAYRVERERRRRRKLELIPVTATQIWVYRLLFGGIGFAYLCLLMGTPA